ncbi:MAG: 2-oxo-4-hydroxy-4-carboxy-5-ureidoimidazoline decarboxylase [Myxococcota bacterium]
MAEAALPSATTVQRLNTLDEAEARAQFERCCGARRWVEGMLGRRPFASASELVEQAESVWASLQASDYLEAFSHHPEIGQNLDELRRKFQHTADWSQAEQAGTEDASEAVLLALRDQNRAYRARFGYTFIICATGKRADEMLAALERRLQNSAEVELEIAAAEQAKITRLRLEKLVL